MKLVLSVTSSNDHHDGGCEWALVDFNRELAPKILRRIESLQAARSEDPNLIESYFWSADAVYFSPWRDVLQPGHETESLAMEEKLSILSVDDNSEYFEAGDDFDVAEWMIARVDCTQMVVREDGVAFVACPKGLDYYVRTPDLPVDLIRKTLCDSQTPDPC